MRLDVLFYCEACGLMSPANAEIPDDTPLSAPLTLFNKCFHCNATLTKRTTIVELKARKSHDVMLDAYTAWMRRLVDTEPVGVRDWFAGAALEGMLSNGNSGPPLVAALAYQYADAMLAAREATPAADSEPAA